MNLNTFTPMDLAEMPSIGNYQEIAYNWEKQSRVSVNNTIYCGKQTFDMFGKPTDDTNGSGSTIQTFDMMGKPNDNKQD